MPSNDVFTVITGASQGLGYAFAEVCARMGRHLILLALPQEGLVQKAQVLAERYQVRVETYELDLTQAEAIAGCNQWISTNFSIDMLINNAGVGGTKRFEQASEKYIDQIVQLNTQALVKMTHQLLPLLHQAPAAYILNIASLAAIGPFPYKTVYPASKAFVQSFSLGLYAELKDTRVHVSVALPGGMATHPEVAQRMQKHGLFMRSSYLSPEATAEICLKKLLQKKARIVPGFLNKVLALFLVVVPYPLRFKIFSKTLARELPAIEARVPPKTSL